MNPPYVQSAPPSLAYESAESRDMYAYFLEHALKNAKGVIAITPQSFTHGRRHRGLRSVILRNADDVRIFCFDNVPDNIFKGYKFGSRNTNRVNSTRAAVLVALKRPMAAARFQITPLLRWKASQRHRIFESANRFLSTPRRVSPELFPKVPPGLEDYYESLRTEGIPLGRTTSPRGHLQLLVPTTPRYFLSAVRRQLNRASSRTLRFDTDEAFIRAYLTLNSSIAYFWWRVHDGGMTLSADTLSSIPIRQDFDVSDDRVAHLVERLQQSEQTNLVVKINSGRPNENVKHPVDLIMDINELLSPEYAEALLRLHDNSYL